MVFYSSQFFFFFSFGVDDSNQVKQNVQLAERRLLILLVLSHEWSETKILKTLTHRPHKTNNSLFFVGFFINISGNERVSWTYACCRSLKCRLTSIIAVGRGERKEKRSWLHKRSSYLLRWWQLYKAHTEHSDSWQVLKAAHLSAVGM